MGKKRKTNNKDASSKKSKKQATPRATSAAPAACRRGVAIVRRGGGLQRELRVVQSGAEFAELGHSWCSFACSGFVLWGSRRLSEFRFLEALQSSDL